MPPTKITSSIFSIWIPESLTQLSHGFTVLARNASVMDSSLALVNVRLQCFGPDLSAVKYGKLISVWVEEDNSILAFSAASLTL